MKGDTWAGGNHSKVRVTALLCTNMDGSDWRVPCVTGKSKKPRCFRSYVPVRYRHNAKGWMTRDLFAEWLSEFDRDMQRQGRRGAVISSETISFVPMKILTLRNHARTRASLMKCGARAMRRNRTRMTTKLLSLRQ